MLGFKRIARLLICDIIGIIFSAFLSIIIANLISGNTNNGSAKASIIMLPVALLVYLVFYAFFGLFGIIWRFCGIRELLCLVAANLSSSVTMILVWAIADIFRGEQYIHREQLFSFCILVFAVSFITRMIIMFAEKIESKVRPADSSTDGEESIMIIGAGGTCDILIRSFMLRGEFKKIKCIIDDDGAKFNTRLHGVKIVGNRNAIPHAVEKYKITEIIFAIPSMTGIEKTDILAICKENCAKVKTMPDISKIFDGGVNPSALPDIDVEDLLGREPIKTDNKDVTECINNKTVLVTGGGGSIGSELCRQIASYNPKCLVILDIYENNAYEIQQELIRNFPGLNLHVEIASVRDTQRLYSIFDKYHPDLVYHAAAHKHVPLMEANPHEAIKNNVFGTLKTVMAASSFGVKRFVMISTDKAVNPTNIMGATKRICEMIIQAFNRKSDTEFVAVRFGNVLGSNGSVIPLFKKQIAKGGPVTVTHPDIIRYFMTIPEAVSLVLQAGAKAAGGEIFVLNMGKPVKILELAENVIRLSGYVPYKDIDIQFTGLRPGEKLYEELLMSEEGLKETDNKLIFIGKPIDFNDVEFFDKLEELSVLLGNESSDVKKVVSEIVTTYKYEGNK